MNTPLFHSAKAVFFPAIMVSQKDYAVAQYGFYRSLDLSSTDDCGDGFGRVCYERVLIRLTARNLYRLYINGETVMHGPARTAHGYCRVDELDITELLIDGINHIAVEVVAYNRAWGGYNQYSNDSTLEDGLFIAEIEGDGDILTATGDDGWQVCEITARARRGDRISHCRGCEEIYFLNDDYYLWKLGYGEFVPVEALPSHDSPTYLRHDALTPTLAESVLTDLVEFGTARIDREKQLSPFFYEVNSPVYNTLTEHPLADCRRTVESDTGLVRVERLEDGCHFSPVDTEDYFGLWDGKESRVGFIRLSVTCEKAGIIDLIHSELLKTNGRIPYHFNIVTRLHVSAGLNEITTIEPSLSRYMQIVFRGVGEATVHNLSVLDYAYPDEHRAAFLCSDDNVNRLYAAAKKTLLLNTLDIFMDCPDRERGGWLCDSLWTGRAASLMLGDNRVER